MEPYVEFDEQEGPLVNRLGFSQLKELKSRVKRALLQLRVPWWFLSALSHDAGARLLPSLAQV